MLRHIAKSVVDSGQAARCKIEAAYCIGVAEPVALHVDAFGTGKEVDIEAYVRTFPLTPEGVIEYLDLRKPIYKQTACYGHFGNAAFPWEKLLAEGIQHIPPTPTPGPDATLQEKAEWRDAIGH